MEDEGGARAVLARGGERANETKAKEGEGLEEVRQRVAGPSAFL